jgi:hypothetical protein
VKSCEKPEERIEIAKLLLEHGANMDYRADGKTSVLHILGYLPPHITECGTKVLQAIGFNFDPGVLILPPQRYKKDIWEDAQGATPIMYSMSTWSRAEPTICRLDIRDRANNRYKLADFLAGLSSWYGAQFSSVQDSMFDPTSNAFVGRQVTCSLGKLIAP